MKLFRQENEIPGGILESEAWQLGLYGPGRQKLNGIFQTWSELRVRNWGGGDWDLGLTIVLFLSLFFFLHQNNPICQVVTISRILTPLTVTRSRLTPGAGAASGWAAGEQASFIKMQKNKN